MKEGTENRGAIEAVVRVVRKSVSKVSSQPMDQSFDASTTLGFQLLQSSPPVTLPPNSKRRADDGWTMIDAGDFAVHVVSRESRVKFFPSGTRQFQDAL